MKQTCEGNINNDMCPKHGGVGCALKNCKVDSLTKKINQLTNRKPTEAMNKCGQKK